MNKLKVGDKVRIIEDEDDNMPSGTIAIIESDDGGTYPYKLKGVDSVWRDSELELATGKVGRPRKVKPDGRLIFKVLKDSCNNYEETIKADSTKKALREFSKKYAGREGYTIYRKIGAMTKVVKTKYKLVLPKDEVKK